MKVKFVYFIVCCMSKAKLSFDWNEAKFRCTEL